MWRLISYDTCVVDSSDCFFLSLIGLKASHDSMKLTIISEDNVLEQEVNADMEIQDVLALVAAEVSKRSWSRSCCVAAAWGLLTVRLSCRKSRFYSPTILEIRCLKGTRPCKAMA